MTSVRVFTTANASRHWVVGLLLLAATGLPLAVGKVLCATDDCAPLPLELVWLSALRKSSGGGIDQALLVLTWAGSLFVLAPLALWDAYRRWQDWRALSAAFVPLALAGAALLSFSLKHLIGRPRPAVETLIEPPADASFPSGHAMHITAFALAWLLAPGRKVAWWHWALALLTIFVVGWSRLHLQVHFASDVVTGIAVSGLLVAALAITVGRGDPR